MASFSYDKLSQSKAIRVLRILPHNSTGTLVCELSQVSLDNEPVYEALSYTWGDSRIFKSIICNGAEIPITINLFSALQRLRLAGRDRTVWADAICINQQDQDEVSQQVRMMGDIYRRASQVAIHLGDDETEHEVAFTLLDKLAEAYIQLYHDSDNGFYRYTEPDKLRELGVPAIGAPEWAHVMRLFNRPYFERMWIQQEVALSTVATVYYGMFERPWIQLARAAKFVLSSMLGQELRMGGLGSCARIDSWRRSVAKGNNLGYYAAVQGSRNLKCTNPRDRIYAILGIIKEPGDRFDMVDYNAPISEVYAAFTLFMIQKERSLKILGTVEDSAYRNLKELPTWVTDWTASCFTRQLGLIHKYRQYRAAGDTTPIISLRDGNVLSVRGSIFDTVENVGSYFQQRFTSVNDIVIPDDWEWLTPRRFPHPVGQGRLNVFRDILTAGRGGHDYPFVCWFRETYGQSLVSKVEQATEDEVAKNADIFKFGVVDSSNGTSFLTTEKGYAGTGPPSTLPGDLICILDGGPIPFILRPRKRLRSYFRGQEVAGEGTVVVEEGGIDTFELVGECYIQGIMDGELFAAGELSSQDFFIC